MPQFVSDFMTKKVISIPENTGLRSAFFLMRDEGIRHLPVVDAQGKMVGIISDRELRRPNWVDEELDMAQEYKLSNSLRVENVMIKSVISVKTTESLSSAVKKILDNKIGAMPVMDDAGEMVGMLSAVDLLKAFQVQMNAQEVAAV